MPNSIVVTRGCPFHCDFCYKDAFFQGGKSFYTASVDSALEEIERLPGRHLYFLDDHFLRRIKQKQCRNRSSTQLAKFRTYVHFHMVP